MAAPDSTSTVEELLDPETITGWIDGVPWIRTEVAGNALGDWVAAALTFLVVGSIARLVVSLVCRGTDRAAAGSTAGRALVLVRSLADSTRGWWIALVSVLAAVTWVDLPDRVDLIGRGIIVVGMAVQVGLWVDAVFRTWTDQIVEPSVERDPSRTTSFAAVRFLGQLAIWSVVLLLALDNLGLDVSALVTGLGIGGIAVALAAQNLLGDLFASVSIVLDRPFEVGDFIIVDDYLGRVQHIGLKTTRIAGLGGEQLVFGNTDLLSSRIRNYKRMRERRVAFDLDIEHGTPSDRLRRIPTIAREAIEARDGTRFDRANLKSVMPTALRYEIVYFLNTNDYNVYMEVQEAINLDVLEGLEALDVRPAHPTYSIRMANGDAASTQSAAASDQASRPEN